MGENKALQVVDDILECQEFTLFTVVLTVSVAVGHLPTLVVIDEGLNSFNSCSVHIDIVLMFLLTDGVCSSSSR